MGWSNYTWSLHVSWRALGLNISSFWADCSRKCYFSLAGWVPHTIDLTGLPVRLFCILCSSLKVHCPMSSLEWADNYPHISVLFQDRWRVNQPVFFRDWQFLKKPFCKYLSLTVWHLWLTVLHKHEFGNSFRTDLHFTKI